MSYKLLKPYTDDEYADFIIKYNHQKGLDIKIMDDAVYALEVNEIMDDNGEPVINPNFEAEQAVIKAEIVKRQIKSELYGLDLQAIRPLRAIISGTHSDEDLEKIKEIETKAVELRINLNRLQ